MAQYRNDEHNIEQMGEKEQGEITKIEIENIGDNIDPKGGRVLNVPDFVELATQGFSEAELKDILRLRQRYENGSDYEITPEYKRLNFAKWLFNQGKLES